MKKMLVRKFSKTGDLATYLGQLGMDNSVVTTQGFIEEDIIVGKCAIQFKGFIHECGMCNVTLRVGEA